MTVDAVPARAELEKHYERGRRDWMATLAEVRSTRSRCRELRRQARACRERSRAQRHRMAARLALSRRRHARTRALRRSMLLRRDRLRAELFQPVPPRPATAEPVRTPEPVRRSVLAVGASAGRVFRDWRGTGARAPTVREHGSAPSPASTSSHRPHASPLGRIARCLRSRPDVVEVAA